MLFWASSPVGFECSCKSVCSDLYSSVTCCCSGEAPSVGSSTWFSSNWFTSIDLFDARSSSSSSWRSSWVPWFIWFCSSWLKISMSALFGPFYILWLLIRAGSSSCPPAEGFIAASSAADYCFSWLFFECDTRMLRNMAVFWVCVSLFSPVERPKGFPLVFDDSSDVFFFYSEDWQVIGISFALYSLLMVFAIFFFWFLGLV